jgi:hypothetical protein
MTAPPSEWHDLAMTVGSALDVLGWTVGLSAAVFVVLVKMAVRTSPVGVLRRLRSSPEAVTMRVRSLDKAWNPGGAPGNYWVVGPGIATYRLDRTVDGQVVSLTFTPAEGTPREYTGVVSERLRRMADGTGRSRWFASGLWILLGQLVLGLLGVALSLAVTSGHSGGARAAGVFIGFVAGAFVPVLGGLALTVGHAAWTTARGGSGREG